MESMSALMETGGRCSTSCVTCPSTEPLPGYDALTTEQIAEALADADAETVRGSLQFQRKFQHRHAVLDAAARALPGSRPSAREERARDEKAALLREGYADRARSTPIRRSRASAVPVPKTGGSPLPERGTLG